MKSSFFLICLLFLAFQAMCQGRPATGFSEERWRELQELTKNRADDFLQYIADIADPQKPMPQRIEAINRATELFAKIKVKDKYRSAIMQVSGKNGSVKSYPIEKYFQQLLRTGYAHVEIISYDTVVVSKFEKGADGDYYSTATYFQQFKGYDANGKLVYGDRTRKDISVTGQQTKAYTYLAEEDIKIFFGDIRVTETIPNRRP